MDQETDNKPFKFDPIKVAVCSALIGAGIEFSLGIPDLAANNKAIQMIVKDTALGSVISGVAGFITASIFNAYADKQAVSFTEKYGKSPTEDSLSQRL